MPIQNPINNLLITGVGGLRVQTLANDAAQGDVYYLNANRELIRLPIGSSGQAIVSTGTALSWSAPAPGGNAGGDLTGTYPNPTIANDAVTFAKMQNVTTATILGRATAGTGDPEALTPTQARTVMGLGTAALANTGTASGNVPVLNGSGLLDPAILPPLAITLPRVSVTGTTQQMANNTVYHINSASKSTLTLPAAAAVGDVIEIIGVNSGGWAIAQNASQAIRYLGTITTTGVTGRIDTQLPTLGVQTPQACVTLECVATNSTWIIKSSVGNLDIV